jgi:hypothetical protein
MNPLLGCHTALDIAYEYSMLAAPKNELLRLNDSESKIRLNQFLLSEPGFVSSGEIRLYPASLQAVEILIQ